MITQATKERVNGMSLTKVNTCSSIKKSKQVGLLQVTKCWAGGGGEKNHKGFAVRQSFLAAWHAQHSVSSTADD